LCPAQYAHLHTHPLSLELPVTSQADAIKAARVYRETQPAIDALKDTMNANTAAKKILGEFMLEQKRDVFRGVTLRVVRFDGWDGDKLAAFLGDKAKNYRKPLDRKYFGLAKRNKPPA
jgi:hypothetical protein